MPLRHRIVKPWFWLKGLLIILALLGHDLLMASRAPAAAMMPATEEIPHHRSSPAVDDVAVTLPHGHPTMPHPSVCGIGGPVLLQPVDQLRTKVLNTVAVLAACHHPASAPIKAVLWEEPHGSPGTRRALLQVYRI